MYVRPVSLAAVMCESIYEWRAPAQWHRDMRYIRVWHITVRQHICQLERETRKRKTAQELTLRADRGSSNPGKYCGSNSTVITKVEIVQRTH